MAIERVRDQVFFSAARDFQYRHIEVIESAHRHLKDIIKACNETINLNLKVDLLRAEISKRQSRREILKKTQYEFKVLFKYHEFSNKQYKAILIETLRELEVIESVLKFLPSLSLIEYFSHIESVITTFENFCRYNGIDELNHSERIKFVLFTF